MPLPAVLTYANGGVKANAAAIVNVVGGVGFNADGSLATAAGAPTVFPNGVPCADATGAVATIDKSVAAAPLGVQDGIQFDANSRLVTVDFSLATPPISVQNELPSDASGALVTST